MLPAYHSLQMSKSEIAKRVGQWQLYIAGLGVYIVWGDLSSIAQHACCQGEKWQAVIAVSLTSLGIIHVRLAVP